jgi:hypothetical protein
MQDLQEANGLCEGVYERAEIYLEFGLAIYELGNIHYGIELLRKAVQYFYPGMGSYHKQVVARCMLGAMEWMEVISHKQAIQDWKRCIEEFEHLRLWADRDNLVSKEEWYARRREILRAALLERRKEGPRPAEPESEFPEESGPIPAPSMPGSQDPNLYQDLLAICRGDREMAERLIELERKKVPNAGRNEWIKRAIERWIDDNR